MYAGLKLFSVDESLRSAFGTVSCMLPIEVYLKSEYMKDVGHWKVNMKDQNISAVDSQSELEIQNAR
jgi:hypothetical protein